MHWLQSEIFFPVTVSEKNPERFLFISKLIIRLEYSHLLTQMKKKEKEIENEI